MIINKTIQTNFNQPLTREWEAWAEHSLSDDIEKRDIALIRLKEFVEQQESVKLDLSNLHLSQLPPLPTNVVELYLDNNCLSYLPSDLPSCLEKLSATHNHLLNLPADLPESIMVLLVDHNLLVDLPNKLPECLLTLSLSHNQYKMLPETLPDCLAELDVSDNQLEQLPQRLPEGLERLNVSNNDRLNHLCDTLPESLLVLQASGNRLVTLPQNLPSLLCELDVSCNQLTDLPNNLPSSIKILSIHHNRLTHLPCSLPKWLFELHAHNNQLSSLPTPLPCYLKRLEVSYNRLVELPNPLPTRLYILQAASNQLMSLPEALPPFLKILDVSTNGLTQLPDRLPESIETLYINNNPLTHLPVQLPSSLINVDFDDTSIINDKSTYFLEQIMIWNKNIDVNQWENIKKEDNANAFARFLQVLHQGKNRQQRLLKNRVADWLNYLAKTENRALRAQTFITAEKAIPPCVDRASFYFNRMYIQMMEDQLTKSAPPIDELIEANRRLFRLKKVEQLAARHVEALRRSQPDVTEERGIYLAYQCKLKNQLSLPIYTELQFDSVATLTDTQLSTALETVVNQEKAHFLRYLIMESASWRAQLMKWKRAQFEAIDEAYQAEIESPHFKLMVEQQWVKQGIASDDEEAKQVVTKQQADTLWYEKRYQLTRQFLIAHKSLSLIAPFDAPQPRKKGWLSFIWHQLSQ